MLRFMKTPAFSRMVKFTRNKELNSRKTIKVHKKTAVFNAFQKSEGKQANP